jgi:hypothetical protein
MSKIKEDFNNIFKSWINGLNSNDIFYMILYWIQEHIEDVEDVDVKYNMKNIILRMETNDEINNIVEDFIYGDLYKKIRDVYY